MIKLIKSENIIESDNSFYIGIKMPCKDERFETNFLIYNIIDATIVRLSNINGVIWRVKLMEGNFLNIQEENIIKKLEKEYSKYFRLKKLERILDDEI